MSNYNKITALYSRLSVGDEDRDGGESNSIQNQKIFLENYARGQHLTNIRHYIDDDESGRFFDRSAYLNADRKACIRIIQNLIFNAVTSTTNNVVIQLINIADSVQLCIKNPVASIPTEEYSKLLERFYVADVSRSNGTSGQGLYIVKKLLLMMNCTNPIIEIHDHNFMITIDFSPLLIKK